MNLSLDRGNLERYLCKQINAVFPDREVAPTEIERAVGIALERLEFCFSRILAKYYVIDGAVSFNHLMGDQFATFLYYLSNTLWKDFRNEELASKFYCLNKAMYGLDAFYEIELPSIFRLVHPVGTVLGRAKYSDYLVIYQRVSVGSNLAGVYPVLGSEVVLFGGSSIIGESIIGSNSCVSIGALVMEADTPKDSLVFGSSPELKFKSNRTSVRKRFFDGD